MESTVFICVVMYVSMYMVLCGIWNHFIVEWSISKQKELISQPGGYTACLVYTRKVSESWMVKITKDVLFLPFFNVVCILVWPIYLIAASITAIYSVKKYLKIRPEFITEEMEEEDFEEVLKELA